MKNVVVFKFHDKAEQTKNFPDFMSALRWQGELLRKKKTSLDYARVE